MADKIQLPPLKSFEEIWAMLTESTKKHDKEMEEIRAIHRETAEAMKETDRRLKEAERLIKENRDAAKETDRLIKENSKAIKENNKQMGFIQNKLGELIEHIVMPGINEKFKCYKYNFGMPRRGLKFYDKNLDLVAEVDIVMTDNAGRIMLGEVKTTLAKKHIDDHVKRIEAIRKAAYPPQDNGRVFMGFMAGAIVRDDVKEYARQKGFFVAVQSGDTVKLDVPEGFVPKTW